MPLMFRNWEEVDYVREDAPGHGKILDKGLRRAGLG